MSVTPVRSVPIEGSQIVAIEEVGKELLRAGDVRATALLSVVLQWRSLGRTLEEDTFSRRVERDERTLTVLRGGAA